MNRFKGKISEIKSRGSLSLVKVKTGEIIFTTIIIDTPETLPVLQVGKAVEVVFKESEVLLARGSLQISVQNRVTGFVKEIEKGDLLSKILITTDLGPLTALITSNAVHQLELKQGDPVMALIKTNEVMLSYD